MKPVCPDDNANLLDQSSFWDSSGIHWDQHRIGWAVAGGCAAITVLITSYSVFSHARNYHNRNEQRQIIRIFYMPPIYAIISFLSFRFFRDYTFYSLVEVVYEAVTLSAFMLLLIQYVASTASGHKAENALLRKDKQPLPFPFCFWRFRPTKAYFMYTVKWSVMQYVIISPLLCIAGIISQTLGVLCPQIYSVHYAQVYITAIDFVSISIALYGLILFYGLTKHELQGRRPFAKFICIKGIVMLTFYQEFVFSLLKQYNVIKGTEFWTATNIADGLNALTTCIEMVFFAGLMVWAYPPKEYRDPTKEKTGIFRPLLDSINYADFLHEITGSLSFFVAYTLNKPNTHTPKHIPSSNVANVAHARSRPNFEEAFGFGGSYQKGKQRLNRDDDDEESQPAIEYGDGGRPSDGRYGYNASVEAIPLHPTQRHLNASSDDYSTPPTVVQYD